MSVLQGSIYSRLSRKLSLVLFFIKVLIVWVVIEVLILCSTIKFKWCFDKWSIASGLKSEFWFCLFSTTYIGTSTPTSANQLPLLFMLIQIHNFHQHFLDYWIISTLFLIPWNPSFVDNLKHLKWFSVNFVITTPVSIWKVY